MLDYLTVNETAKEPPQDEEGKNSPSSLAIEATYINQNFSQQMLVVSKHNCCMQSHARFHTGEGGWNLPPSTYLHSHILLWSCIFRVLLLGILADILPPPPPPPPTWR